MKKFAILGLAALLVVGVFAGVALAHRQSGWHGGFGNHMGGGPYTEDVSTGEEIDVQGQPLRTRGMMGPGFMMGPGRRVQTTINSEYEFLVHMIPHHEEAVSTARTLQENTERQELKEFAEEIIVTQTEEIEQMKAWLEERYPQKDRDYDYQPMMRDFTDLEGEEAERVFLEDMIFHHMQAVMTSQQLLSRGLAEQEEVAALAENIINTQREEIFMMRDWLASWYEDEQLIAGSPMGRMWQSGNTGVEGETAEENLSEVREAQRNLLRKREELEALREEYRQLILEEAPEEELTALEDEILALQSELEEESLRLQQQEGLTPGGFGNFRTRQDRNFRTGGHCW